jgi:ribosomal protein L11 methyltransferase
MQYFIEPGMDTVKVTLKIAPFEQWICDVLMSAMAEAGYDTFVECDNGFEAYIPNNLFEPHSIDLLKNKVPESYSFQYGHEIIEAQNWNEIWEKNYFTPLVIRDQVVVRAPFHVNYPECTHEIVIEPNMAFGTGNHETTSLMMEMILDNDLTDKSILDMGCGTAILSILSEIRGAGSVDAIDIDEWAYEAAIGNCRLNQAGRIKTILGDANALAGNEYDIILANIQKNVILKDLPSYCAVLRPSGKIMLSGFFEDDLTDIIGHATALGLSMTDKRIKNKWTVALFVKGRD